MSEPKWGLVLGPEAVEHIEVQDAERARYGDAGCCCELCKSRESIAAAAADVSALRVAIEVIDQWDQTPDYQPTHYDRGRVDQRHAMCEFMMEQLVEAGVDLDRFGVRND